MSEDLKSVFAPMSGVFYCRPAPGQPPFVEVGTKVKKGHTLCLLETMKLFTKVTAPSDGTVAEILVKDEETIEKNQIIMRLSLIE